MFGKNTGALDGATLTDQQQKFAALAELHQEVDELTAELSRLQSTPLTKGITEQEAAVTIQTIVGGSNVVPLPTEGRQQETIDFAYDTEMLRLEDEIQQLRQADAEKAAEIQRLGYQIQEILQRAEYAEDELAEAQYQQTPQGAALGEKLAEVDQLQRQLTEFLKEMKNSQAAAEKEGKAHAEQLMIQARAEADQRLQLVEAEVNEAKMKINAQQQAADKKVAELIEVAELKAEHIISEAQQQASRMETEMTRAIEAFREQAVSLNQRLIQLKSSSDTSFDKLLESSQQLATGEWERGAFDADH